MQYQIFTVDESKSYYGPVREPVHNWYWAELNRDTREPTGNIGSLRACTEMEALDRLREGCPDIGMIKWLKPSEYKTIVNK